MILSNSFLIIKKNKVKWISGWIPYRIIVSFLRVLLNSTGFYWLQTVLFEDHFPGLNAVHNMISAITITWFLHLVLYFLLWNDISGSVPTEADRWCRTWLQGTTTSRARTVCFPWRSRPAPSAKASWWYRTESWWTRLFFYLTEYVKPVTKKFQN